MPYDVRLRVHVLLVAELAYLPSDCQLGMLQKLLLRLHPLHVQQVVLVVNTFFELLIRCLFCRRIAAAGLFEDLVERLVEFGLDVLDVLLSDLHAETLISLLKLKIHNVFFGVLPPQLRAGQLLLHDFQVRFRRLQLHGYLRTSRPLVFIFAAQRLQRLPELGRHA
jgi:hypothetical protein